MNEFNALGEVYRMLIDLAEKETAESATPGQQTDSTATTTQPEAAQPVKDSPARHIVKNGGVR